MSATGFSYSGTELDVFALARNWKAYWASEIAPHLKGDVLEVGAGLGTNTLPLQIEGVTSWCCLEPDDTLLTRLRTKLYGNTRVPTEIEHGILADYAREGRRFDTILYIDVLEHIEHDARELQVAISCLQPGGKLIVLAPAHQWLFTPFDQAIGHFRRYNKGMLAALTPPNAKLLRSWYLDCAGLTLSLANRLILKQAHPNSQQIITWDRWVIPFSRFADPLLGHQLGKTVVAVWTRH